MTDEEVKEMKETVGKGFANANSKTWQKAFNEYNTAMNEKGKRALGMGCRPCYYHVLNHFLPEDQQIPVPGVPPWPKPNTPKKPWG